MSSGHGGSPIADLLHGFHDRGVHVTAKPFIIAFIAGNFAFLTIAPGQTLRNFEFLLLISPLWITPMLAYFSIKRWITANRVAWLAKQEYVLLEVRVPRDVRKTPLAMETDPPRFDISCDGVDQRK